MVNVGCDFEISIKDLAYKISKIMHFDGDIVWDLDKPDGTQKSGFNYINNLGEAKKTVIKG